MKILLAAATFAVLFTGCTSTYSVGPDGTGAEYNFNTLNARIGKRECTIVLANQDRKKVKEIVLTQDSTSWLTTVNRVVSASQVSVVDRIRGERKAQITFTNGQRIFSEEVAVTPDSVSWLDWGRVTVPTAQIRKIIYVNHLAGVLDGVYIGTIAGLGSIGVYALLFGVQGKYGDDPAGIIVGIGGIVVFCASPIVGLVIGRPQEFDIQLPKHPIRTKPE